MLVVIMAGGKGTRFWPRSVEGRPKQFLAITDPKLTMIQQTYERFRRCLPRQSIYVITAESYAELLREQLPELGDEQLLIEPDQKDTAPCTALAALRFLRRGVDEPIAFAPADQYIPDFADLHKALEAAERVASADRRIVTLGIVPTRPETGYGYIQASVHREEGGSTAAVHKVVSFIEKPSPEQADVLARQPHVYWNSGIYVWKPSTIAYYMKQFEPQLWSALEGAGTDRELEAAYMRLKPYSIDFAVMEKADTIYTLPVTFVWDDVGAWTALERIMPPDPRGNIVSGDAIVVEADSNIVHTERLRAIVMGVRDLIIVETEHGLLVCHKSEEQRIKRILADIGAKGG